MSCLLTQYITVYRSQITYNKSIPFFFNDTATTEIYTLSLHDALPIWEGAVRHGVYIGRGTDLPAEVGLRGREIRLRISDRKSTRLNSSHSQISYGVFCFKKKIRHPRSLPCAPPGFWST